MNGIVVNIRGINASGKSTSVREYCKKYNMKPETILFENYNFRIMRNGGKCAIGWYKPYSNSEGVDPFDCDKEKFKRFLKWYIQKYNPEVIIYEKAIWSHTFKLTNEINKIVSSLNYQFVAVVMNIDYTNALNRLYQRNGGKDINLQHYDNSYRCIYSSRKMLIQNRIPVYDADVMKIPKDKMGQIIDTVIQMHNNGNRGKVEENIR